MIVALGSNNTNKLSPQEPAFIRIGMQQVQIIQINLVLKNTAYTLNNEEYSSNNTNKLSPQELIVFLFFFHFRSNNTNKLSPQELSALL